MFRKLEVGFKEKNHRQRIWIKKLEIISLTDDWDHANFCGKKAKENFEKKNLIWKTKCYVNLNSFINFCPPHQPPTPLRWRCQPRFKMQSRANFPSSQLQIISNFEFPRNFPDFHPRQFFHIWISLLFIWICARFPWFVLRQFFPPRFNSVSGAFGRVSSVEKRGLVDLVSLHSSSLIDQPTYFNHPPSLLIFY